MKKHHRQEAYEVRAPPTRGPTAWPRPKQPMTIPISSARFPIGTAAEIDVTAPVSIPEPPTPVTALAAIRAGEVCARPETREPTMKMAMKEISVSFRGNSWNSLPERGDIGQLHRVSLSVSDAVDIDTGGPSEKLDSLGDQVR